jgi:hypothetical protein
VKIKLKNGGKCVPPSNLQMSELWFNEDSNENPFKKVFKYSRAFSKNKISKYLNRK